MRYCIPTRAAWTTWVEHSVGIDSLWFQNISGNWQTSMENARGNDMFRGKLLSTIKAYKYNVVHGHGFKRILLLIRERRRRGGGEAAEEEWRMVSVFLCAFIRLWLYILLYTKLNKNRSTTTNSNYLIGYINEIAR